MELPLRDSPRAVAPRGDIVAPAAAPVPLLHVFSTFAVGGSQVRFATLANALGGKYRHIVMAMDGRLDCGALLDPALDCRLVALQPVKGGGVSLRNLLSFRRRLAELRPAILLTYNWGTIEWALARHLLPAVPHLHFEDGFGPDESPDRQIGRRVWLRRIALSGKSRLVVPSRTLERLATEVWRLDQRRVLYIPNGISTASFAAGPDPALTGLVRGSAGELVIGTIGILRAEKNLKRLIRVFARLPAGLKARLVIVGDGPEKPALAALARELGLGERVVLTGMIKGPERVVGHFDVFALSSDTEQMPLSIIEAMAAGLPIVATQVGDVMDMVAPENRAYLVAAADEAGMAAHLAALLGDAPKRQTLGRANRERVRSRYELDTMIAAYDRLFSATASPSWRTQPV